jgi:hypothetical protein
MKTSLATLLTSLLVLLAVDPASAQQPSSKKSGGYPVVFVHVPFEKTFGIPIWNGKTGEERRADYEANLARVLSGVHPTKTIELNKNVLGGSYLTSWETVSDWPITGAGRIFEAVHSDKNGDIVAVVMFSGWSASHISGRTSFYLSHQLVELLRQRKTPLIYVCPWNRPTPRYNKYEIELAMSVAGSKIISPNQLDTTLAQVAINRAKNPPNLSWEPEPMTPPSISPPPMPEGIPQRQEGTNIIILQQAIAPTPRFPSKYAPVGASTPEPEKWTIIPAGQITPKPMSPASCSHA